MATSLVSDLQASGLTRHAALKAVLSAKGLRQFAVARHLGISEGRLSRLLSGQLPLEDALAARIEQAIGELTS